MTGLTANDLIITRDFNAPREQVFRAWEEPGLFEKWWGPKNYIISHCTIDFQEGGMVHYAMRSPEGDDFWGKGVYRKIIEPELIEFIDSFSDEEGNTVSPEYYGLGAEWPSEPTVTVNFESAEAGKTKMTVHYSIGSASESDRNNALQGFQESLDKLEELLAKTPVHFNHK